MLWPCSMMMSDALSPGLRAITQAVSAAAATRGMRAIIVMPEDAPAAKIDGTKALGGEVVTYDRYRKP